MPDYDRWYESRTISPVGAAARAALAWRRIQDRPASIALYRDGATLSAQTVRVEYDITENERRGDGDARTSAAGVVLFGVRGHPDSAVADTNIERGDRFAIGFDTYEVQDVILVPGEVQARSERLQS